MRESARQGDFPGMARIARVGVPGCWHHVTQRGNQQQAVFFENADRGFYLDLLREHADRNSVRITGYCLMGNHVHLLLIPEREDGLANALGRTHNDYSRWLNLRRHTTGHVWQNRFYSCPLDEAHSWEALRYVELNPVRASLARSAAEWPWSSARAHIGGIEGDGMIELADWRGRWTPGTWHEALDRGIADADLLGRIRESTRTGRPLGGAECLQRMEAITGRSLRPAKRGPKPARHGETGQLNLGVT